MDYQDEEEAIAEAIRLSLLESGSAAGPNNTFQATGREQSRSPIRQRRQQPPQPPLEPSIPRQSTVIDLTDDFESDSDGDSQNWPAFLPVERPTVQRPPVPQAPPTYRAPQPLMEGNDEEEDEDLKRALALSLEYAAKENPISTAMSPPPSESKENTLPPTSLSSSLNTLLGASRAELERERQERLQKRAAPSTSPPTSSIDILPTSAIRMDKDLAEDTEHRRKIPKTVLYSKGTSPIPTSTASVSSPLLPLPSSIGFASKSSASPLQGGSTLSSSNSPNVTGKFEKMVESAILSKESGLPNRGVSSSSLSSSISPQTPPRRPLPAADHSPSLSTPPLSSRPSISTPASSFIPSTPALSYSSSISSPPASRASSSSTSSSTAYLPRYRRATFFNTHIKGKRQDQYTIRFGDLVDKNYVQKAILTTFQLDPTWLDRYLPTTISQCRFVHWYKDKGEQPGFHRVSQQVVEVHPPMTGSMGIFHPKLMLLFYPGFCRVVVSTANLVDYDWEELVNSVYVQDFVMRPSGPVEDPEELGEFGCSLHNYLKVMTAPEKVLRVICAIDFSSAKVLLVPSVQGSFPIDSRHAYGLAQLGKIMETRSVPTQSWDMEYTTGSLGKLTVAFLRDIDRASKGLTPRVRSRVDVEERMPSIKVIFPTERNVHASRNGEMGAGTVCFQQQYWKDPVYPRSVMHDFECVGEMKGSLMHTKMILAKAAKPTGSSGHMLGRSSSSESSSGRPEKSIAGWIYLGSANFTESAWGKAISKKAAPPPKKAAGRPENYDPAANKPMSKSEIHISIRNWELGILYPIETEEELESYFGPQSQSQSKDPYHRDRDEQTFFGPMPVPYKRPVRPYVAEDSPWFR